MKRKYGLSIVFVLTACSLLKEEAFKLNYNQRKVIDTIGKVELMSLQSDGSWTPEKYSSFLFNGDLLVADVSQVLGSSTITEKYAVEVIKDISDLQGVYRLHGSGQYAGMYLGIVAITNSSGAFAKIAMEKVPDNILDKAHNIHYWGYASDPLINRAFKLYGSGEKVVRLKDDDLKYYVKQTTNLVFSGKDLKVVLTQILPTTPPAGTTETHLGDAIISSVKLYPPNIEIYHLKSGNYMGIEYYDDPVFEKLRLKVAYGGSEANVLNELKQKKLFNWESESTAEIPSRVLNTVAQKSTKGSIVKTTLFSDTSSLASHITIQNAYDWENTIQIDIDTQTLAAKVIEVNNKISNTASYKIKMIEDESETAGIFQLSGTGLLNGQYLYLQITNTDTIAGLLSMNVSQTDVKDPTKSTPVPYQDRLKAQQPHRVVINLEKRGVSWLGIQEDGYYDNLKTTNYSFNSQNRTVRIKIITNSTPMLSSYKLTITSNESEDFGVLKLEKTNLTLTPGATADNDSAYPFDGNFLSIKLGSGVDSTRARLDITDTNPTHLNRTKREVLQFNLSEQSALPSGNKIIKHMGALTPWVKLHAPNGYYIEDNTEIWNVDPDVMEVTITRISTTGGLTTTNANKFPITMENDVSSSEGGFKLGKAIKVANGSGGDFPDLTDPKYEDSYFYVVTGIGPKVDEARIAHSLNSSAEAKQNLPTHFNFHTLENVPLSYAVIENIYQNAKDRGHTYIQYEAPATVGAGSYLPYKTMEYTFLLNPLQVQITEIREDNTRTSYTYPIQMLKNNSVTEGAFKLLGSGPLSGRIVAVGVDHPFPNPPATPMGRRFRLYMSPGITDADTVEKALEELKKLKDANKFTHDIKQESLLSDALLTPKTDIWSMLYDPTPNNPNYAEMLYDRKNTSNFIFDTTTRTVMVKSSIRGINNQESYKYEVMETLSSDKQIILLLDGNGLHGGKYLGFKKDVGTAGHAQITISNTVGNVKTALAAALTNYRKESTLTFSSNVFKNINWTSDADDSFIKVQENGIWNGSETEELFFNYQNMTLQAVETKNGLVGRSYTYNIIMLSSTENVADTATTGRKGKFYLKSADNDATAPLHKKYVRIQVEDGADPKKIRLGRGATYAEAEAEFNKLSKMNPVPPNAWNFRDKTSTAIDVKSIITASTKVWTRLKLEDGKFYYYDSQDTENWTFNAENRQVTVQFISGTTTNEEAYDIGMRQSIDDNNGIFVLSGSGKRYDQKVVRLELGTDVGNNLDKDRNARIVVGSSGATADLSEKDAVNKYNKLKTQNEWNFRENHLATRPNRAITEAIKVKEWYSLEDDTVAASLMYDSQKFNSLKFQVFTNSSSMETRLTNIIIQRTSAADAHTAVTMNYKIDSDISDQRAIIQLVGGGQATGNTGLSKYTNKYMAIELGTAINDRLMKVGIGDSPEAAQNALNLQVIWNYMDKEMATANDRVIQEAIGRGSNIWISYRGNMVGDSDPNPTYSSANATNVLFIRANKTIKMQYVTTQNGVTETLEFIYGYTMIEDESTTKGVLRLSGYGEFADTFMAIELGSNAKRNRAQIAFGTDTAKAKQALETLKSSQKWNLFERKSLLTGHRVLTTLVTQHATKGKVVKLTGSAGFFDVYDEKNTKRYTFDTSQIDPTVTIEAIVTGVPASHTYTVEMLQDRSTMEGIFQLLNPGSPDHGKYFGIKLNNGNIHLFSDNDLTVIRNYFVSNMPPADHRYEHDMKKPNWRDILTELGKANIVRLDQDGIYLSSQTENWNYNAQNDDLTIVKFSGATTTTTTYKAIPITNIPVSGGEYKKGIFFLNSGSSTDPYHKKYIGVTILADKKQIKLVSNNTLTGAISALNSQTAVNAATLDSVNISDSVLQDVVNLSTVWKTLSQIYLFDSNNTIQYTFDIKDRILSKKVIRPGASASEVYYRIKMYNENNAGNTNVLIQLVASTLSGKTTPSGDSDINKFMALGIPSARDALFYSLDQSSNTAITRRNSSDPYLIAEEVANNSTRALDLWGRVNDSLWFKTDNTGALSSEVALNFDLNRGGQHSTSGPAYVFNLYMRATKGTSTVVDIVVGKQFFVRTVKDISPTSSIIRIYGQNPSAAGTFASGSGANYQAGKTLLSQISNKFFGIEIGQGVDYFKAKIVEHDTVDGAQRLLENQKEYNYRADKFIRSTLAFMTNLAFKNPSASSKEVETWLDLSAESNPAGYVFDPNNHTNWTINVANRTLTVNIVGSSSSSYIYEYHKMYSWSGSELKGFVSLDGIGPYKNKILLIHRKQPTDNKAVFAIGDDFATVSNKLPTSSFTDSAANLYTLDSKRIPLGVIDTIGNNDSVVSLYDFQTTTPRRIYDPEETIEYSFDTTRRKATVYKVSGGVSTAYPFDLVMIENINANEGVFQLVNGPVTASGFDRWFYGIKVSNDNVVITSNSSQAQAKSAMQSIQASDPNAAHFRRKRSVPGNNSRILTDLSRDGSIVLLDENRAYRDQTTDEYSFDASTKSLQIIKKVDNAITSSFIYKVVVVEDYKTSGAAADQLKGTLLLKSSSGNAPLDKNFLAVQRHHQNTAGNSYQNTLSTNTFRITNNVSKTTAESLRDSAAWRWHRKNPLNINDTAFRKLGTLFEGKWATLQDSGQNKYLYDRRSTQEMRFDYNNKMLTITNILPRSRTGQDTMTNIGSYTVWITNIAGSTDNDAQKISFLLYHVSGGYNNYNGKWGSIKIPTAEDAIHRGIGLDTLAQAKSKRDDGDPTLIPLLYATNSSDAISNLNRLGRADCWHPVDRDNKTAKGELVYDPNPGENNNINPGPVYAVNFNLGIWTNTSNPGVLIGTREIPNIPGPELSRFFVRVISSTDPYNAVFKTYAGVRKGPNDSFINQLTNSGSRFNVSNVYHALTVGTGPNLYKAKIARGRSPDEAIANLNALSYYNYVNKQALGSMQPVINILSRLSSGQSWAGNINGQNVLISLVDANINQRLISVRHAGENVHVTNTYQMEHLYNNTDHEHDNGTRKGNASGYRSVFKLVGFGSYGNRLVRVSATQDVRGKKAIKLVIGTGIPDFDKVIDIDKQWAALNSHNMTQTP